MSMMSFMMLNVLAQVLINNINSNSYIFVRSFFVEEGIVSSHAMLKDFHVNKILDWCFGVHMHNKANG